MGKKRRRKIRRNRFIVTLLLVVAIVLMYSINKESNSIKSESLNSKDIITEVKEDKNEDILNVLILGVDTKEDNTNVHSRTDTIMVASLDIKNKKASLISIPRDTRVQIKGRKYKDKINHAHAYGGVELSINTVENLLQIPIDRYVKLDFIALEKIIDKIGGVEIYVPIDMKYSDPYADPPLKINLKKGKQVLTGSEAIQFVRFRKGYADQDLGRIGAQQSFIKSVLEQTLQPKNAMKIPSLIDIFFENTETNLTKTEIVKYTLKGMKIDPSEINMQTLPGKPRLINGIWYYEPNTKEIQSFVENRFIKN